MSSRGGFQAAGAKPTLGNPRVRSSQAPRGGQLVSEAAGARQPARRATAQPAELHEASFTEQHLAFLDFDAIYFDLQRFKNERAWYNLAMPRESVARLCCGTATGIALSSRRTRCEFRSFEQVRGWQEIASRC